MKSKIMDYNPYIGDKQSTNVCFDDDSRPTFGDEVRAEERKEVVDNRKSKTRVVELGMARPSWFRPIFLDKSDNTRNNKV